MVPVSVQPIFVIIIVIMLFVALYKEYFRASVSFLIVVLIFIITGILDTREAVAGFSNPSIIVIMMLILVTTGLRKNFQLEFLFDAIFSQSKTYPGFLFRMMSQVAILSSFINNTPVVTLMAPYVVEWGKKNNISPSRLLIPLSYAAIMGGMITVIGTSTTLVLNGFLDSYQLQPLRLVDFLIMGLIVSFSGITFISLLGHKLLPNKDDAMGKYAAHKTEYVVETRLGNESKLIGQSVREAGMRNLKGVYLVEIIRDGKIISPVGPDERLSSNDTLIFAGNTDDVVELVHKIDGLNLPTTAESYNTDKTEVIEGVLSPNSGIIGKTVKECEFRNRYNAAIIAIHRKGERVRGRIGDIKLKSGDLFLLYAGEDFRTRVEIYRDLFIVSKVRELIKNNRKKYMALASMIFSVGLLSFSDQFSLFQALLVILTIMAGFSMISVQDVKRELDLNLVIILVFSLAVGQAMVKTGAGELIAKSIIDVLLPLGKPAVLIGLILMTNLLTSFITNVGAISISFPLAYSASQLMGVDGYPFYLGIAFAASSAFLTPIGYQTNLIVMGPGGYKFKDFVRVGLPVNFIYITVVIALILIRFSDVMMN